MTDALNRAVRATFEGTAGRQLRLVSTHMAIESAGRVLGFTGFHADGKPFCVLSAAFTTSPIERAAQMAQDIIATHTGAPMSAVVTGVASTIRLKLGDALTRAAAFGAKADASVENLNGVLAQGEDQIRAVDQAAADLQAALGFSSNGG